MPIDFALELILEVGVVTGNGSYKDEGEDAQRGFELGT
jgi:hypothetical protein